MKEQASQHFAEGFQVTESEVTEFGPRVNSLAVLGIEASTLRAAAVANGSNHIVSKWPASFGVSLRPAQMTLLTCLPLVPAGEIADPLTWGRSLAAAGLRFLYGVVVGRRRRWRDGVTR